MRVLQKTRNQEVRLQALSEGQFSGVVCVEWSSSYEVAGDMVDDTSLWRNVFEIYNIAVIKD